MKAGFIGLGGMGEPMARNLAKAGHLRAVWNRTPATAAALAAELEVAVAQDPADLTKQVDVVFLCVSADQDVIQVVDSLLPAIDAKKVVVDHSTVSSATACLAADKIGQCGGDFLDIPVSGGVEGARLGTLAMMAGGSMETLERIRPLLASMAARIVYMGVTGSGQATKAVNQIMCAGINQAVTEALGFAAAHHLDLEKVIDVISAGAAGNWFLDKRGRTMTQGVFAPGFKLALHHKDLNICLKMAEAVRYRLPVTEMTVSEYAELMARGHGEDDISGLYRLKRPTSHDD
jgi:3-hydroxyisobutyrate dehydrogenase